jgi:hypothetical protein
MLKGMAYKKTIIIIIIIDHLSRGIAPPSACRILKLAQRFDQQIVLFLWCHASRQQCYDRVCEQWTPQDTEQRREFRLKFILEAPGRWFCGMRGEEPSSVLRDYEYGVYD